MLFTPFVATPVEAFGERVYDANQVINAANHLNVYSGESVAQSFVATDAYRLLNLTLRLKNDGDTTDAVNVSIRADVGGVPADTYFAAAQIVIGNNNLGNYNVPFASPPGLAKGVRYWIVATCPSILVNTYEWHHSAADVYGNGKAMVNLNLGGGWANPGSATDMYFVTYGQEIDANLTARILATASNARPGDLVTFRIYLNNTGSSSAPTAWLNDTQLPGLTYVSDTSAAAGSSTSWPSFTFANVANGLRSFDLTARIAIGTAPGTFVTKAFTVSYLNATRSLKTTPSTQASVFVGKEAKQLYLNPGSVGPSEQLSPVKPTGGAVSQYNESLTKDGSNHDFDLAPVLARSFRVYGVNATLYLDSSTHSPKNLDVNLTLADWNGVTLTPLAYVQRRVRTNNFADYEGFAFALPPIDHVFPSGGRIRLTVRDMPSSDVDLILAMNSTFASSRLDADTTTYVRIDLLDLRDGNAPTGVWSPKDALVVQANVSDPFGSSEISGARLNLTSPSGAVVVNDTAMSVLTTDPASPSAWKLFRFAYAPPLAEGVYQVSITATESNGVADIAAATALVRVPHFTLTKKSTFSNVGGGDRFTYYVWFNNTGPGTAGRVWINDSLPDELTFLSSSDPGAMTGSYNWTWTSLVPASYRLGIDVQLKSGLPPTPFARNYVFLNYTDEKGFLWPLRSAFADVTIHGPAISLSIASTKAVLHANEILTYSVTMQDTGEAAQSLWVNDTLPAGLSYVSDTSASLGGTSLVSGRNLYFRFSNMSSLATWSFTITAIAGPSLVRGSILTNTGSLNYTNSNGFLFPPRSASWAVLVQAPSIASASVAIGPTVATPSDVIAAVVTFSNVGNEPARDAWINLTLSSGFIFVNASVPVTLSGSEVRFALTQAPLGFEAVYVNASLAPQVVDHQNLPITGTIVYTDGFGNVFPPVSLSPDSIEVAAPRILLSVTPNQTWLEAATIAFFTVYQVNAGSGVAGDIWLTLLLPAGFVYVSDSSNGVRSFTGSTFTWHWTNVAPGPNSFSLKLRTKSSVVDGTATDLVFHTDYTDTNRNFREGVTFIARANFVAPRISLVLSSEPGEAKPGDLVRYNLTIVNLGSSTARNLWLTDAIDGRFEFVSYTAGVQATGTDTRNWSFTDLQPGQQETVILTLRVRGGVSGGSLLPNLFEANYTNSGGTVIGYVRSDAETTLIVTDPLPAIVGVAAVAATLVTILLIRRRFRVDIEEVFLVYRDGLLIYHLSRSLSQDKDEDVLSGMLTAIQQFVRDAFVYGEHRELHMLDFGEYRIMIERGTHVYLAVVYSGKGAAVVRRRVRSVLDHVESAYGRVLEDWDGDMDKVAGARDVIREHLLKPAGRPFHGLSFL